MSFWGVDLLRHLAAATGRELWIWDPPAQGLSTEGEPSGEPVTLDVLQQARGHPRTLPLPRAAPRVACMLAGQGAGQYLTPAPGPPRRR